MEDVRAILNDFMNGVNTISKEEGMTVQAFMSLQNAAFEASALDVKTKELISVGIAAYNRCKYCIVVHVYNAYQAGATRAGNPGRRYGRRRRLRRRSQHGLFLHLPAGCRQRI